MRTALHVLAALAAIFCGKTAAHGQINSPPPALMGEPSFHAYSVPLVQTGGDRVFILCTNTTDAAIRVGVEGFPRLGGGPINDASASSVSIAPGGTALFGTPAVGFSVDSTVTFGGIPVGSARVLATDSKGIICTAFVADVGNDPPTSMVQLNVFRKTKQKGD
jgi:hypothetical protein